MYFKFFSCCVFSPLIRKLTTSTKEVIFKPRPVICQQDYTKNDLTDSHETRMEDESQPRMKPVNFSHGS